MRTIDRLSSNAGFSWLRGEAGRWRRAMMAQRPAVRMGLVLAPVLVLAAAGYWAAGTLAPSGPRYLAQGRAFSSEDLIQIFRSLDAQGISYRQDDHKVEVGADQFDQAVAAVGKLDVGPHAVSEIRETSPSLSELMMTPGDKEQRERLRSEKMIERFIDNLEGVVWSVVCIQYPRAAFPRAARTGPSAFVYLEGEADRLLPSQTVRAIPAILLSNVPDLSLEAITMMDRKGRSYLDPHNPAAGRQTREEELRQKIVERLPWLKGVLVWVELTDRRDGGAGAAGRASTPAADHGEPPRGGPAPASTPAIVVNRPAEAGGESAPPVDPGGSTAEKVEGGRVFVYVPRSYYFTRTFPGPEHREPTVEELRGADARTRDQIEKQVHRVVPESWAVLIDTFADEGPTARTAALPAGPEHRRIVTDWGIVGAVAASVALLMAMGSWIQAARRPARAIASSAGGRTYREDSPDEPGPSERVRELVRRDPEAAASVLQRWATQGGRVS
jgi:flagellar M-ring protein FliF